MTSGRVCLWGWMMAAESCWKINWQYHSFNLTAKDNCLFSPHRNEISPTNLSFVKIKAPANFCFLTIIEKDLLFDDRPSNVFVRSLFRTWLEGTDQLTLKFASHPRGAKKLKWTRDNNSSLNLPQRPYTNLTKWIIK